MTLATGNAHLAPTSPVKVNGFKSTIDNVEWQATKVCHRLNKSGFTSQIEMETKMEEADANREPLTDPNQGITGVIAKWHDKVSRKSGIAISPTIGKGKQRHAAPGVMNNPKILSINNGHKEIYESRASAQKAADLAWAKIVETRMIIDENNQ